MTTGETLHSPPIFPDIDKMETSTVFGCLCFPMLFIPTHQSHWMIVRTAPLRDYRYRSRCQPPTHALPSIRPKLPRSARCRMCSLRPCPCSLRASRHIQGPLSTLPARLSADAERSCQRQRRLCGPQCHHSPNIRFLPKARRSTMKRGRSNLR